MRSIFLILALVLVDSSLWAAEEPKAEAPKQTPEQILDVEQKAENELLSKEVTGNFLGAFRIGIDKLAKETGIVFEIDGNAFKDAGFTKNMPEKFDLGEKTTLGEVLYELSLRNRPPTPDKRIVFCRVGDAPQSIWVTTGTFAKDKGLTPIVFPLDRQVTGEVNTPFQNVIIQLAKETGIAFEIDGNALKDAGFTKNMPQIFNIGEQAALIDMLRRLSRQNKPPTEDKTIAFCWVGEAPERSIKVTTLKYATDQGLKPIDLQ